MSVSIIIVNWNSGKLLSKCLKRISLQTLPPDKIFVVDNASDIQSEYIPDHSNLVEVIRLNKNIGFAAGNNRALSMCRTQFVALLNPDAFPEPKWLENLLTAALMFPNVAAFGSKQLCYENPNMIDGIGDNYHISGLVWRYRHGKRQGPIDNIPQEIFSPCAAAAMYDRQALIDVGGFDEDYFCYVEDVDLGFRLRLAGHKAMYVPNAVVHHVGSATTGGQHSDFSVYYGHRNIVWTYVKNMPGLLLWLLLPLHLLMNITTIVLFTFRGQYRVIIESKFDAIRSLQKFWEKRKLIQRSRIASTRDIWQVLDYSSLPKKK